MRSFTTPIYLSLFIFILSLSTVNSYAETFSGEVYDQISFDQKVLNKTGDILFCGNFILAKKATLLKKNKGLFYALPPEIPQALDLLMINNFDGGGGCPPPPQMNGNLDDQLIALDPSHPIDPHYQGDDFWFYFGLTGFDLNLANVHIVFFNGDGLTNQNHFGMDFSGTPWTYMVTLFGAGNMCYFPWDSPTSCQPVGSWPHFAGFSGNPTSELGVLRSFLGSYGSGTGFANVGMFVTDNSNQVIAAWPDANAGGTWQQYGQIQYPTQIPPEACFVGPTTAECGQPVTFDASCSFHPCSPQFTIQNYTWDFGDGTPPFVTTGPTVTHTFLVDSFFDVVLTVGDDQSPPQQGSTFQSIEVEDSQPPVIELHQPQPQSIEWGDDTTPVPPGAGQCVLPDNGNGTTAFPPPFPCGYLADMVIRNFNEFSPGDELQIDVEILSLSLTGLPSPSPIFPGGERLDFDGFVQMEIQGTGSLTGFARSLSMPVTGIMDREAPSPGAPVQEFDNEMVQLQGQIFGDPDFDFLLLQGGSNFFPSTGPPGHTTLTRLGPPGSEFNVDSFFDITYRIDFQGAPGGALDGMGTAPTGPPESTVLNAGDPSAPPSGLVAATATDSCDPNPILVHSDVFTPAGPCPLGGHITRTWTATDGAGNSSTEVETIDVLDTTPPDIDCPPDVTIEWGDNTDPGSDDPCVITDNGSGTVTMVPALCPVLFGVEIIDGLPPGTTIQAFGSLENPTNVNEQPGGNLGGTQTTFDLVPVLNILGTGSLAGFVRSIAFPLNGVTDYGPRTPGDPVQTFPNDMFTLEGQIFGDPDFDLLILRSGTSFGLPSPGQTTLTRLGPPGSDFNVDSFFDIVYEIEFVGAPGSILDGFGGTTSGSGLLQTGGAPGPGAGFPTGTDNCDTDIEYNWTDQVQTTGGCTPALIITRTWTGTDDCGNVSTSCDQIINVDDTSPPVVTLPPDVTIEWGAPQDPPDTGVPTTTDNCDPNPTVSYTDEVIETGGCFPSPGIIIERSWTATDNCNNTSSPQVQLINIFDTTPPTFTPPNNVTLEWPPNFNPDPVPPNTPQDPRIDPSCLSAVDQFGPPIPNFYLNQPAGEDIMQSSATVMLDLGPFGTQQMTLNGPVLVNRGASVDIPLSGPNGCDAVLNGELDVIQTEIVAMDLVGSSPLGPTHLRVGPTTTIDPQVQPSTGIINGQVPTNPTEACSFFDVFFEIEVQTSGGSIFMYNQEPLQVHDTIDRLPPLAIYVHLFTPGLNVQLFDSPVPGQGNFIGTLLDAVHKTVPIPVQDNCDALPAVNYQDVLTGPFSGPNVCQNGVWIVERTWSAVDDCGNTSPPQTQLISFTDTSPPELICPPDLTIEWGDPEDPGNTGTPEVTDNCDANPVVTFDDSVIITGNCPIVRIIQRTWTAVDACQNAASCTQIISVTDLTPPVFVTPGNTSLEWPPDFNQQPVPPNTPQDPRIDPSCLSAVDQFGPATPNFYLDQPAGSDIMQSTAIVTLDIPAFGPPQQATVNGPVQVDRGASMDLTVSGPGGCNAAANGQNDVIQTEIVAMDLVGSIPGGPAVALRIGPGVTQNPIQPSTGIINGQVPTNPIEACSFFDVFFEVEIQTTQGPLLLYNHQPIQVRDTIDRLPPLAIYVHLFTPGLVIELFDSPIPGQGQSFGFLLDAVHKTVPIDVSDNCDPLPQVVYQDQLFGPFPNNCPDALWVVERSWFSIDNCGNQSPPQVQLIEFSDFTPPTVICPPNITLEWGDPSDPPNTGIPETSDNCDPNPAITFIDQVTNTGDCAPDPSLIITRSFIATDICGNDSQPCTQTILVFDTTPPVFTAPNNVTVEWPPDFTFDPVPPNTPQDPRVDPSCLSAVDQFGPATPGFYLDQPPGSDVMQSTAIVTLDLPTFGPPQQVTLNGPVQVNTSASMDIAVSGPGGCSATTNGENDVIQTEIISMDLTGNIPGGPPVSLRIGPGVTANPILPSTGIINGQVPASDTEACSFFDVFFEVEIQNSAGPPLRLYNHQPIQVSDTIDRLPPLAIYVHLFTPGLVIELFDSPTPGTGQSFGFLLDAVHKTVPIPVTDNCDPIPTVNYQDVLTGPFPIPGSCQSGVWIVERTWIAVDDCGNTSAPQVQLISFVDTTPPEFAAPNDVTLEWPPDFNQQPVPPNTPQDPRIDPTCLGADAQFGDNGPFWFEDLFPGIDVMQSTAIVNLDLPAFGPPVEVTLSGPVQVSRSAAMDISISGPDGCNASPNGQNDVIQTEILSMDLTGFSPAGPVSLRIGPGQTENPIQPSLGFINGQVPTDPSLACSFFDVFFEIEVQTSQGPVFLYNQQPLLLSDNIDRVPPLANFTRPPAQTFGIQLFDAPVGGQPVGTLVDAVHKTVPIPVEDNCDPMPEVFYQDQLFGPFPQNCPNALWYVERSWFAVDACGNQSPPQVQLINFSDFTPPTVICPPDITLEWGDPSDPPNTGIPETSDNCDPNPAITFIDQVTNTGDCAPDPSLIITRSFIATDICGNVSQPCTQTILVFDTTPPVFTAPNNVTVEWPPDFTFDPVPPNTPQDPRVDPSCLSAVDQFGPATPGFYLDQPPGSDVMQSTAIVTLDLPTFGPPQQVTLNGPVQVNTSASMDIAVSGPGGCSATTNGENDVIQTEIISMDLTGNIPGGPPVSLRIGPGVTANPIPPSTGIINGQVPASDTEACSFFDVFFEVEIQNSAGPPLRLYNHQPIQVSDTIDRLPPLAIYVHLFTPGLVIELFDSPTPGTGQSFGFLLDAVHKTVPIPVTDNCDPIPTVNYQDVLTGPFPIPGSCESGVWIIERTWVAEDDCGNTSAPQVQLISFVDTTPPEFAAPNDVTLEWPPDFNQQPVPPNTPQDPRIDPSCLDADAQFGDNGEFWFLDLPPGIDVMQSTAIIGLNIGGQQQNCTLPAQTQVSMSGPVMVQRSAAMDIAYNGICGTAATDGDSDFFQTEILQLDLAGSGMTLRVGAGNNAGPNTLPPSLGVINGADPPDPGLACSSFDVFFEIEVSNPGGPTLYLQNQQPLTVIDTIDRLPPLAIYVHLFQPGICVDLFDQFGNFFGSLVDAVHKTVPIPVTDNCDQLPTVNYQDVLTGPFPNNCPDALWVVERTWIAVDDCGNESAPQVQLINFSDFTPPEIVCPSDITIQSGQSTDPSNTGFPSATDNCDPNPVPSWSDQNLQAQPPFSLIIERTWLVTDVCGNVSSTCIQLIYVLGQVEPVELCLKVYLQGAFNPFANNPAVQLRTTLRNAGALPLAQPYGVAPWNYTGLEAYPTVASMPSNMSEWVLVEIRDGTDPSILVDRAALILLSDGSITDLSGGLPTFSLNVLSSYFIEIHHWNHLQISSATALEPDTGNQICYDWTTAMTQAYRNPILNDDPMRLVNGTLGTFFVMNGGNVQFGDCQIDFSDLNLLFMNYFAANDAGPWDVNRDAITDANDINMLFSSYSKNCHETH